LNRKKGDLVYCVSEVPEYFLISRITVLILKMTGVSKHFWLQVYHINILQLF